MDTPPIEARGLDKSFGAIPVLRGVNLAVAAGRGVMIIGRNGAGKSTLVRILAGLSTSTAGDLLPDTVPAPWSRRLVYSLATVSPFDAAPSLA